MRSIIVLVTYKPINKKVKYGIVSVLRLTDVVIQLYILILCFLNAGVVFQYNVEGSLYYHLPALGLLSYYSSHNIVLTLFVFKIVSSFLSDFKGTGMRTNRCADTLIALFCMKAPKLTTYCDALPNELVSTTWSTDC